MIRIRLIGFFAALGLLLVATQADNNWADENLAEETSADNKLVVSAENRALVPRYLMPLLHAPEVQKELKFSPSQLVALRKWFTEIDGDWFRVRNQPESKQTEVLEQLEQRTRQWLAANTKVEQQKRLTELEYQAQSIRAVLRSDLGRLVGFTAQQQQEFAKLATQTDAALLKVKLANHRGEDTSELDTAAAQKKEQEQASLNKIFDVDQLQKVSKLLGTPFDTASLTRIYPLAPDFVGDQSWINSSGLSMAQLRGKVVLVHFYAFECYNCHANFPIYKRWQQDLVDKGVVVIGIQTPETAREGQLSAVKAAAEEKGLKFPILFDTKSENWKAWGNTMWPTVYVVDKNGYLRHWWQGELNWKGATADKKIEEIVDQLLTESTEEN